MKREQNGAGNGLGFEELCASVHVFLVVGLLVMTASSSFAQYDNRRGRELVNNRPPVSIFSPLPQNLGSTSQQYGLAVQFWLIENVDGLCREMSKMSEDRLLSLDSVRSLKTRLWLTNSVEAALEKTITNTETRVKALEELVRKPTVGADLRQQTEENLKFAQALLASLKLNVEKVASLRVQVQDLAKKCDDWEQIWETTLPVIGLDEMRKQLRGQIIADRNRFQEWADGERGLDLRGIRAKLDGTMKK